MADAELVERWRARISEELDGSVVPFWMTHSLDRDFGGYLNCLDRDGTAFDDKKHVWMQGRQVWMLSRLFAARGDETFLDAARLGAEFLSRFAVGPEGRAYFALARDGRPAAMQRKIFSECFVAMAYAEFARASGEGAYRERALELFDRILELSRDPARLGRPVLAGETPSQDLAVPMILLDLVGQLRGEPGSATFDDRDDYDAIERDCVRRVLMHFDRERGIVRETVGPDGAVLDSPEGRLLNPGHVIEAGWFLATYAARAGDADLQRDAFTMIEGALDLGWDADHGGLFYFLDAEGKSPLQLEWSLKLWWPHCEALVGTLVAWRATGDDAWWRRFEEVAGWTFDVFPDREDGEWFGYMNRDGSMSQRFKGGPYKGFFHVPRALLLCEELLVSAAPPADR